MLTITETVEKLFKQPEIFEKHMLAGEYCKAKWCYIKTVLVMCFIEMDGEAGDRLEKLFPEERVKEAFWKAGGPDDTGCSPKAEADIAG